MTAVEELLNKKGRLDKAAFIAARTINDLKNLTMVKVEVSGYSHHLSKDNPLRADILTAMKAEYQRKVDEVNLIDTKLDAINKLLSN